MRKVFLLSLLLVVLSLVIPWLVVTLGPAQEPAVQPIPSVTASAAVAPDSETAITALSGGALVETTMADWLPGDLNYCFFSDSGSVAVEVALKMALQYYMNQGERQRTMTLSLTHSYHGDTFKTMEVGDDEDYHFVLEAFGEKKYAVNIPTEIPALEEAFEKYHDKLNCLLVEPLLQGAGGMRMYDISFLKRARELCDQYGVLLIFDEVATGFGRTGNRFVADLVLPDILVLGKAPLTPDTTIVH